MPQQPEGVRMTLSYWIELVALAAFFTVPVVFTVRTVWHMWRTS